MIRGIRNVDRAVSWTVAGMMLATVANDVVRYLRSRRSLAKVAVTLPRETAWPSDF